MESSLRAFMLLMLLLAAGVAGVSSSTRPTKTRSPQHAAAVTLHVASGREQHFVFVAPLRSAANDVLPGSTPAAPAQIGPHPTQVQTQVHQPQVQWSDASLIVIQDGGYIASDSDLSASRTSIAAEIAEEEAKITGSKRYVLETQADGTGVACPGGLAPRAAMRISCGCDALSSDFVSTWEIDPDQSQVALVHSLCEPRTHSSGPCAVELRSRSTTVPGVDNAPGGRSAIRQWLLGLRVTWLQFRNWFHSKHLRHETVDRPSAEATADSLALTPDEYAQLIQTITDCAPVASSLQAGDGLAHGNSP